jgi:hypothetical protein
MGAGCVAAIDGGHFKELMADLDAALREVALAVDREPTLWTRGLPGKWTAGQHVTHLSITLWATAESLQKQARVLEHEGPPPRPHRGFLEFVWVFMAIRHGKLPRGGRTPRHFEPPQPDDPKSMNRETGIAALRKSVDAHRALGERLTPKQRDLLWIPNPFHPRWHYTFSEILRVHAVHARHHTKLIAEIPLIAPAR